MRNNREYVESRGPLGIPGNCAGLGWMLEPQTNGGLLVSASAPAAEMLVASGFGQEVRWVRTGRVTVRIKLNGRNEALTRDFDVPPSPPTEPIDLRVVVP